MQSNDEIIPRISKNIDFEQSKILDFFVRMLKINSVNPSMGGPGELDRAEFIRSFLVSEGFAVEQVDVPDADYSRKIRPNVCARIEGNDKSKTLWFLSHMDTVSEGSRELWNSDPFIPVIKDGKIIARGSEDNGQSLVSSLFAVITLKRLGEKLPFNVGFWAVSDEENGSEFGVKYLLEKNYFKPNDLIVVPDSGSPDGMTIEIAEKNLLWFKVETQGKQVHASLPNKGKNAHRIGMELALSLDRTFHEKYSKTDDMYDDPLSTFEPTKIEPNVPNINTVPGIDVFYFDCRVLPEYSLDDVISDINRATSQSNLKHGSQSSLEIIHREDAGPATLGSSEVARLMESSIFQVTKKRPRLVGIGGQTVGNLLRKKGLSTVVWSTVDDVPHEPNEYARLSNLISDAKVFAAMPFTS